MLDPPKKMLDYAREIWYATLHSNNGETEPYRVIGIVVETPSGSLRVPITRVAKHYKEGK